MIFKAIVVIFTAFTIAHGVTIQCDFQNVNLGLGGSQYTCWNVTLTSDGNLTHVNIVTGNHLSGKTDEDVKGFDILSSHQHLNRVPKGIEEFFPNLRVFRWAYGNLTTLTADDLKPLPNLIWFNVNSNKLISLDGDLFKHTPMLRYISFTFNLLEHVDPGLLDGLNDLTEAYFVYNSCIDFYAFTPEAIQELKLLIQYQCQPLKITTTTTTTLSTTAEPEHCSIACVELIETFKDSQRELDERQDKDISGLQEQCMIPGGKCYSDEVLKEEIIQLTDQISLQNYKEASQNVNLAELQEKIARLNKEISRYQEVNANQDNKISAQGDAIAELKKQIRELWARP